MTQWYYASRQQQRLGPVQADELVRLFNAGHIALDTLVWREGLAQWQRLGDFADELSLLSVPAADAAAVPPSHAVPPFHAAPPPAAVPVAPRPGMSGGKIALIIGAVLIVPVIAIIGILAAISLPAYNDYTQRAKISESLAQAAPLKVMLAEHYATTSECPSNGEADFGEPDSYASRYVAQARIGEFEDGTCGIELRLRNTGNPRIDDKHIWLSYDTDSYDWDCSSDLEDRLLPGQCR
ncbi:pilin [Pseudoxanthomonas mexicana]|uniref:pilin n=1 Tax=Pseudoxanthomonas mexicana TaxID=128785 RepID=UPI00398AE5B2